jgi:hypothetical protein
MPLQDQVIPEQSTSGGLNSPFPQAKWPTWKDNSSVIIVVTDSQFKMIILMKSIQMMILLLVKFLLILKPGHILIL